MCCELELAPLMKLIHRNEACFAVAQPVKHLLPVFLFFVVFFLFFFFFSSTDTHGSSKMLLVRNSFTLNSSQWVTLSSSAHRHTKTPSLSSCRTSCVVTMEMDDEVLTHILYSSSSSVWIEMDKYIFNNQQCPNSFKIFYISNLL